jgi:hypothetical protein
MKPEKLIQDGKVAVLYSPGYGGGWSTWAREEDIAEFLLFDRRLVEAAKAEASEDEVMAFLATIYGPNNIVYTGGWEQIVTQWVPVGTKFQIEEYDGSETLVLFDQVKFYEA